MKNNQDYFDVLRKIDKKPKLTQREIASEVGFSLGKLNYCLKELQKKGLVKLENFQKQSNKIKYFRYVITPKGLAERTKLTINFMKKKMVEYDERLREKLEKEYKKKMKNAENIQTQLEDFKMQFIKRIKEDELEGELIKK